MWARELKTLQHTCLELINGWLLTLYRLRVYSGCKQWTVLSESKFQGTSEPMWFYGSERCDSFSCSAAWGLKITCMQSYSALTFSPRFSFFPIFSKYYAELIWKIKVFFFIWDFLKTQQWFTHGVLHRELSHIRFLLSKDVDGCSFYNQPWHCYCFLHRVYKWLEKK